MNLTNLWGLQSRYCICTDKQYRNSDMYLRDEDVAKRFGVARSTIWRWVKQGLFPQPYRLGPSTTRWQEKDILAFEARAAGCWGDSR